MSVKTLTITIKNIPDHVLKKMWKESKKASKSVLGVPIEETDNIEVDTSIMWDHYKDYFADAIAASMVLHSIDTTNKIFNNSPG